MYGMLLIPHKDNPNLIINGYDYDQLNYILNLQHYIDNQSSLEYYLYVKSQIKSIHCLSFDEVHTGRYIFPIRFDMVDGKLKLFATKEYKDNFAFHIPEHVLNDVKSNQCKILVDYSNETYDLVYRKHSSTTDSVIKNTISKYNLKPTDIILLTGNPVSSTDVKEYTVVIKSCPSAIIPPRDNHFIKSQIEKIKLKQERTYKILTLIRKAREHRLRLLEYIYFNNLRDDNFVTCSSFGNYLNDAKDKFNQEFVKSLPWVYDLTDESKYFDFVTISKKEEMLYLESYISLSAETLFLPSVLNGVTYQLDVSEKTYKPIVAMQPFIVLGQPGTLSFLKDQGFKTFSNWWDESYDQMYNNAARSHCVFLLYKKLSKCSKSELAQMLNEMLPVLVHNENLYREMYDSNNLDKNLLDTLAKCFDK
jgi:hypothetical protein